MIDLYPVFRKAVVETDETWPMIGHDGCQDPITGLPDLRVWDYKVNAHTVA